MTEVKLSPADHRHIRDLQETLDAAAIALLRHARSARTAWYAPFNGSTERALKAAPAAVHAPEA